MIDVQISYSESEQDIIDLFTFLCLMAKPVVLGEIDADIAIVEVNRLVKEEFPIVAKISGEIVGALGLIKARWWYGPTDYLTDRWFFIYPQLRNRGVGAALLAEAGALGQGAWVEIVINGHMRRKNRGAGAGILFTKPVVIHPEDVSNMDWNAVEARVLGMDVAA